MDIRFKNSYIRNKELIKEMYRYYFFKQPSLIVCYSLLFLSFLVNTVSAISGQTYYVWIFVFVPLLIAIQVFRYCRQVNTTVKRDIEVHGREMEVEITATDDCLQNTNSTGTVSKIGYDKIKRAVQTKNLILLCSKTNLVYIFRKDSFESGTTEKFVSFLKAKGISVKGK